MTKRGVHWFDSSGSCYKIKYESEANNMRVTMNMIRSRVEYLNKLVDGVEFGIGGAYGGHRLERLYASGGCSGLTGYRTNKELLDYINAFIDGIELVNNIK